MNAQLTPWRATKAPDCWQVMTREDDTPGSRNNYVIADGIQSEDEAKLLASAPKLLEALKLTLATLERVYQKPVGGFSSIQGTRDMAIAAISKAES